MLAAAGKFLVMNTDNIHTAPALAFFMAEDAFYVANELDAATVCDTQDDILQVWNRAPHIVMDVGTALDWQDSDPYIIWARTAPKPSRLTIVSSYGDALEARGVAEYLGGQVISAGSILDAALIALEVPGTE